MKNDGPIPGVQTVKLTIFYETNHYFSISSLLLAQMTRSGYMYLNTWGHNDTRAQPSLSTILSKNNDILFHRLACEVKWHD